MRLSNALVLPRGRVTTYLWRLLVELARLYIGLSEQDRLVSRLVSERGTSFGNTRCLSNSCASASVLFSHA